MIIQGESEPMLKKTQTNGFIDRRQFIKSLLKASAFLGTFPVLTYAAANGMSPKGNDIKKYITGCMWCQNGCSMIVHVRNGKAIHLTGNPDDPVTKGRICIKPFGSLEFLNSAYRLTHPLKRVGKRGNNAKFIHISWKDALDEIAEKLKDIHKKYGGESLGIWASGRSAYDGRILNKAFAKLYGTPNYEKTGPFCNYSGKPAGISVVGTRHTPWIYNDNDFYGADLYIFMGSNMAATRPVIFSVLKKNRIKRQCKFITVDPRRSETAKASDTWLAIKPGRDLALALTMIHYIITHQLIDKKFVEKYVLGFHELKKEMEYEKYTLDWGSKITGLPASQIVYFAETYARTKKAIIIGNAGLSHHTNAVQTHRAFYFLAAITGHFGKPSTGYACLNNGGISLGGLSLPKDRIPKTPMELSKNPVGWLESLENPLYPYKLRALISTGSPLTQWPDQSRIREFISKLELSVYNGLTRNINTYYFDYILPAATWIESGGLAPVSDDSRFVWVPRIISPPGMAKPDRWWWIELGKRMGWQDIFTDDLKNNITLQNTIGHARGYSVRNFVAKKNNALRAPVKKVNGRIKERNTLFLDKHFFTKSGKIELYNNKLEKQFNSYGLTSIPRYYTDPEIADRKEKTINYDRAKLIPSCYQKNKCYTLRVELADSKKEQRLPFYLITGRPSKAIMGHTSHWIKILNNISPDQFCLIHHEEAKSRGINHGDIINVCSRYGEITAKAVLTSFIRRDTIFIPYSYGEKTPFTPWKTVNYLVSLDSRCPVSGQIAFKGTCADIYKTSDEQI